MNRKRILLVLMIVTLAAGSLAAEGARERDADVPYGRGDMDRYGMRGMDFSEDTIEVTGSLSFEAWGHPVLNDGSKSYNLMVPRFGMYDLDLQEGQRVLVEGYIATDVPWNDEGTYLRVTRAVIDGEEYDIDQAMGGGRPMAMGRMGGRHHDSRGNFDGDRSSPRGGRW